MTFNIESPLNNEIQQKIIKAMQAGLPICARPYQSIAQSIGIDEAQLFDYLKQMKASGVIRRIGAVPNHYAIGYRYNLMTVWDIQDDDIGQVGERVGQLDFVSHCYQRPRHLPDWPYNFFAMVHGRSQQEVDQKLKQIAQCMGDSCRQFDQLKSVKILKKTGLRI